MAYNYLTQSEIYQIKLEMGHLNIDIDFKVLNMKLNETLNPFNLNNKENPHVELLRLIRSPDYFFFTCKYILGVELLPFQLVILETLWKHTFPMFIGTRGLSKSFLLAVCCVLKALINQGSKIVITGAGFRQSKTVFQYIEKIWNNAPILRNLVNYNGKSGFRKDPDSWTLTVGDSMITALPIGSGEKIRGQRANFIIAEEFASMQEEIYEHVISGFGAVSASPIEAVKQHAKMKKMKEAGILSEENEQAYLAGQKSNQSVISGTADYDFKHFAKYWKRYKAIIESKGNKGKLEEIFNGEIPNGFNWKDYAILRIPYDLLPEKFMDEKTIAKSRATFHKSHFFMEFGAIFPNDSEGFYKRTLIESCVTQNPILTPDGLPVKFHASVVGNPTCEYVYGIDPAYSVDKFGLVILECHPDHRRVVYCWTTNHADHQKKVAKGLTEEKDFYGFCVRKIRDLMKVFPCKHIALDSQGGGSSVLEALHNKLSLKTGEQLVWLVTPDHIMSDRKERSIDEEDGLHIVELVQFADSHWTSDANHGLKKDMETKTLLFPFFDNLDFSYSGMSDDDIKYDTLEDCMLEIEELKNELSSIVHTSTTTGRDKWDTPEIKMNNNHKGRMRKDRYSALLMANSAARRFMMASVPVAPKTYLGGFANQIDQSNIVSKALYSGPKWMQSYKGTYGAGVKK